MTTDEIAAKEAELAQALAAMQANFDRPIGGRSRTKAFGRQVDAQLRRAGQLGKTVKRLERELEALRNPIPEPAPLDLSRLPNAAFVRTTCCWYRVVKVNAKSVKVKAAPGMDDRIPIGRIVEIREHGESR